MFWGKMSRAEKFLRNNRFTKTTKGLNISLMEYAVSEKNAKKALEIEKQETAKQVFEELEEQINKCYYCFEIGKVQGILKETKAKFLQEQTHEK